MKETATHVGEYHGLAPTSKKLSYTVVTIWRIVEGKIVEGWIVYNQMDFLKQLGVIEYKVFPDEKLFEQFLIVVKRNLLVGGPCSMSLASFLSWLSDTREMIGC